LIGDDAADAVTIVFNIAVYGIVIYIVIIQLIRLLNNFNNRNAEDQKVRQEARENIKGSVFIIVMVALIGGFGFTALSFLVLNQDFGLGGSV
jgi:nitrate reductase NapE component